jgi:phage major head subunit gpT-like protein
VNITRRGFISMLAIAGTGAVLLPNRKYFLPTRFHEADMAGDFTTDNLRYECTERFSVGFTDSRGVLGAAPDLSAASLEDALVNIRQMCDDRGRVFSVKPTLLLVHPDKVEAAKAAFPGQVEARYFADPNAWYLKTDAQDMKMASLLERHAMAAGIRVRRA